MTPADPTHRVWDWYRGRRVLVTGHRGFKGAWLSEWLLQLGADVVGVGLPPSTAPSLYTALELDTRMTSVLHDVRNPHVVDEIVRHHRPEIVFHLAAQALVRQSFVARRDTFETNVIGTVNIIEAAAACDDV